MKLSSYEIGSPHLSLLIFKLFVICMKLRSYEIGSPYLSLSFPPPPPPPCLCYRSSLTQRDSQTSLLRVFHYLLSMWDWELPLPLQDLHQPQAKKKAKKLLTKKQLVRNISCEICNQGRLTLNVPPMWCDSCAVRIGRMIPYYTMGDEDTEYRCCVPCYFADPKDRFVVGTTTLPKSRLRKKKNDEEIEEPWVKCDTCKAWRHQICALFNGRINDGRQAEYTCPSCCNQEHKCSAVLGAKDLPTTNLSDYIEKRLFRRLEQERQERAMREPNSYEEKEVSGLVVKVVSSVNKRVAVKPHFLRLFQEENYPAEFPYTSKAILLFQKIEGIEVCLFGTYVQEFGSECQIPNQRRVYLSYLDSVKYFQPDSLRTFVYHEILIGYLEYCKKRGFTSCYIWVCPPKEGEDYIWYCHPKSQKSPGSNKLREWYESMLRKATKEDIVVNYTNLYDHFFESTGECRAKVTATRLPYFDGDHWPGVAENFIPQLQTASKDRVLMLKLGKNFESEKQNFVMVHLQHACSHCCILMVTGNRWVCNQCKSFQICDKCYEAEKNREERERHPKYEMESHALNRIEITDVPADTKDQDEILESEIFDTRATFLSFCKENCYQFDSLRRAKYSSMMILHHLHNPTDPAVVTTCDVCKLRIETDQGWGCESCPEYDVCNACQKGCLDHPHQLTRQNRGLKLKKMLDLLVHCSTCSEPNNLCQPNCRKMKAMFFHARDCKPIVAGSCPLCDNLNTLFLVHAKYCEESQCLVPRCRQTRYQFRREHHQADSRKRAAATIRMR